MELVPVIGLEIHVQLKTKSKMFCPCDNTGEDKPANTTICPVCMGHPGTLPVPNAEAISMAVRAALALNFKVNTRSKFDRKNYFYPDLPKGYQISQYDEPLAQEGYLEVEASQGLSRVELERLHLEEDTAKLTHQGKKSLVDFNRAGTPLMEIVTKPEIKNPEEAKVFLQELRLIMRYVGASDADMEKGHLRCDANISLHPKGEDKLYPKTEIKNLNSFRAVEKALQYEVKRQGELWRKGEAPAITATRGWDEAKGETVPQREKEAVHDYRYFPEPDIPPLVIDQKKVEEWRAELPELPADRRRRWQVTYDTKPADARLLTEDKALGDFAEHVIVELAAEVEGSLGPTAKLAVNWIVHKLTEVLRERGLAVNQLPFTVSQFVAFLLLVSRRQVNSTNGQLLLRRMVETG
ncbi:MAG: Asp-tRNA(Asn)/Glu-tRNA(Gln) amidotransferase subunit GatB, partial [Candidatus Veblenbacteria bacterium]|nr:Asp-tRNA(Asn)/Glu-tRNA(Gln) amidotransferase subunit GatB [Candidatus Veblenbacteria bacterium]